MCNACGFYCCASDVFEKCGCDHCPEPACWPDDDELEDDPIYPEDTYDDDLDPPPPTREPPRPHVSRFRCEEVHP